MMRRGRWFLAVRAVAGIGLAALGGCSRAFVVPIAAPPHRDQAAAPYDVTWKALIRAFAMENVPLRVVARDSGVIASDDFVSPIGVYADCGSLGGDRIEGEALVSYTLFAVPNGDGTRLQINSKMRTFGHRRGSYQCVSTLRFEANLVDAIQELAKE